MANAGFWRDPNLPFVESRAACDSRACYRAHSHRTWSIGVVDRGRSRFSGPGGSIELRPGSLVSIPSEQVHACNPDAGAAWSYQMLYLDRAWLRRVLGDAPLPERPQVRRDATAYRAFCAVNRTLFSDGAPTEKEAALVGFLRAGLWRGTDLSEAVGPPPAGAHDLDLARARALLETPVSLETAAAALGLSRYQLIRRFQRHTGLTPHAYKLDRRVDRARALLREGASLVDVAHALGFADQSHFQRAFKERTAATPGAYQRGAGNL